MTQDLLNELFYYYDGMLYNKIKRSSNSLPNTLAGTLSAKDNYRRVSINNKIYLEHRIIYIFFNGEIENGLFIDHINNVKNDNRIENLRLCNRSENQYNRGSYKNSKTGIKGVCYYKPLKKYSASMGINNKKKHLGYFDTPELAKKAYDNYALIIQKEFATK